MAKPEPFTEPLRTQYLQCIRDGMRRGAAADLIQLPRIAVREYIESHPEYQLLVEDAEADATEHVEEALYQAAISGNVPAARVWLELNGRFSKSGSSAETNSTGSAGPAPPSPPPDEDDLFFGDQGNVARMDPRRRKKDAAS